MKTLSKKMKVVHPFLSKNVVARLRNFKCLALSFHSVTLVRW
jgi:hypothetical protein